MPTVAVQVDQFVFEVGISAHPAVQVDQFVIEVAALFINPSISCGNPPPGSVNVFYTHTLVFSAGEPPYSFTLIAGSLPPGLGLNASTGVISGLPTEAGQYTFTVQVTDANGNVGSVQCSILIAGVFITFRGVKRTRVCSDEAKVSDVPEAPHIERAV